MIWDLAIGLSLSVVSFIGIMFVIWCMGKLLEKIAGHN